MIFPGNDARWKTTSLVMEMKHSRLVQDLVVHAH